MYGDKMLEMQIKTQTASATSAAICLGQGDLPAPTDGIAPYDGLYFIARAGEALAAAFTVTLQHSDTKGGTYTTLIAFPALAAAASEGDLIAKAALPHNAKNWLRCVFSAAKKMDAVIVHNPDKYLYGLTPEA
jgi:hypothetical protein